MTAINNGLVSSILNGVLKNKNFSFFSIESAKFEFRLSEEKVLFEEVLQADDRAAYFSSDLPIRELEHYFKYLSPLDWGLEGTQGKRILENFLRKTSLFCEFKDLVPNQMSLMLACRLSSICSKKRSHFESHRVKNQKFFDNWGKIAADLKRFKHSFVYSIFELEPEAAWEAIEKLIYIEKVFPEINEWMSELSLVNKKSSVEKTLKKSIVDPKKFEGLLNLSVRYNFFNKTLFYNLEARFPVIPGFHYMSDFAINGETLSEPYHIPAGTIEKACRNFLKCSEKKSGNFMIYKPEKELL